MSAVRKRPPITMPAIAPPLRDGSLAPVAGTVEVSMGVVEGSAAALDVAEKISGCDALCKVLVAEEISAALEETVMSKVP
jgi:hypothetical protein